MSVNHIARPGGKNRDILSLFLNMKVYCEFSLESLHRGDSNEYTKYTIFSIKKIFTLNYPKYATMGFFSKGPQNEFEMAVINEPSVFEPLKFYRIMKRISNKRVNVFMYCVSVIFK